MNLLWRYDDYVKHLAHPNPLVRRWAFEALDHRFANRYTDAVSALINEEDALMTCAALRYLRWHEAVQHAPAILEVFKKRRSLVADNCAVALGQMRYEPAAGVMIEYLGATESPELFLGIVSYLGNIHREDCREALRSVLLQIDDPFTQGTITESLLRHRRLEDIELVLDRAFKSTESGQFDTPVITGIAHALECGDSFNALQQFGRIDILSKPGRAFDNLMAGHPAIKIDGDIRSSIVQAIVKRHYTDFYSLVMEDARCIVSSRCGGTEDRPWLAESLSQDTVGIAVLEELFKRSVIWKKVRESKDCARQIVSFITAAYLGIQERGHYLLSLAPDAGIGETLEALKNSGHRLPEPIQKRITAMAPVAELKNLLTEDLMTWGDIWAVRLMGRIGNGEFAPELVRVLSRSDSLEFIHSDTIAAIHALDESADEYLLNAIQNKQLDDWDSFAVLEHLPYSEAHDVAVQRWEDDSDSDDRKMDSYEAFAGCLAQIGDPRGIAKLQNVYASENDAVYIGDALDCLGALHQVDIPEMPDILQRRKEHQKSQRDRMRSWNDLAYDPSAMEALETFETAGNVVPFTRSAPKAGRNQPCPCGSGRKYKKCCLN
jgi:hypothetical protein